MNGLIFGMMLGAAVISARGSTPELESPAGTGAVATMPLPWNVPRTIRTTDGHSFLNVTIRYTDEEGVIINYGKTPIKIFYTMLDGKTLASIRGWNP